MCSWLLCRDRRRRPSSASLVQQPMVQAEIQRMLRDGGYDAVPPTSPRNAEFGAMDGSDATVGAVADCSSAAAENAEMAVPVPTEQAVATRQKATAPRLARPASAAPLCRPTSGVSDRKEARSGSKGRPNAAVHKRGALEKGQRRAACGADSREAVPSSVPAAARPKSAVPLSAAKAEPVRGLHSTVAVKQLQRPPSAPCGVSQHPSSLSPVEVGRVVAAAAAEVAASYAASGAHSNGEAPHASRPPTAAPAAVAAMSAAASAAAKGARKSSTAGPTLTPGIPSAAQARASRPRSAPQPQRQRLLSQAAKDTPLPQSVPTASSAAQASSQVPVAADIGAQKHSGVAAAAVAAVATSAGPARGEALPSMAPADPSGMRRRAANEAAPPRPSWGEHEEDGSPVDARCVGRSVSAAALDEDRKKRSPSTCGRMPRSRSSAQLPRQRLLSASPGCGQAGASKRAPSVGALGCLRPVRCRGGERLARQLCSEAPADWGGRR